MLQEYSKKNKETSPFGICFENFRNKKTATKKVRFLNINYLNIREKNQSNKNISFLKYGI